MRKRGKEERRKEGNGGEEGRETQKERNGKKEGWKRRSRAMDVEERKEVREEERKEE